MMSDRVVLAAVALVFLASIPVAGLVSTHAGETTEPAAAASEPSASAGIDGTDAGPTPNESTPPGSVLAGAVSAHQSSVGGELADRTLAVRLARAATPDERAQVLATVRDATAARLDAIERRRDALGGTGVNDTLSPGASAHVAAELSVETAVTHRLAARGERAAAALPASVAAARGVTPAAFAALANRSEAAATALDRAFGRLPGGPGIGLAVSNGSRPGPADGGVFGPSRDGSGSDDVLNESADLTEGTGLIGPDADGAGDRAATPTRPTAGGALTVEDPLLRPPNGSTSDRVTALPAE
jgi:hypothetical protein